MKGTLLLLFNTPVPYYHVTTHPTQYTVSFVSILTVTQFFVILPLYTATIGLKLSNHNVTDVQTLSLRGLKRAINHLGLTAVFTRYPVFRGSSNWTTVAYSIIIP